MQIRGLIFDLGHTLIDLPVDPQGLRRQMFAAALEALRRHGLAIDPAAFTNTLERWMERRSGQESEEWIEHPLTETFALALEEIGFPGLPEATIREAVRAFLAPQEACWRTFPDTHETLEALQARGYRLALLTNSGDADHSWRLIERFGLRRYFDPIVISAAVGLRKPHPWLFLDIARRWGLPPAAIAVVGDLPEADLRGARLAGMRAIWAVMAHGPRPLPDGLQPDAVIHALRELLHVLGSARP